MLAVLLQSSSDPGADLDALLSAIMSRSWLAAGVAGIALVMAVLYKVGVLGKPAAPAPAAAEPAKDEAQKAQDLLDGKK